MVGCFQLTENILNLGHFSARWSIRVHVPFRGTHWPFAVSALLGLCQQRWVGDGQCRVGKVGDEPFQHTYAGAQIRNLRWITG